MNWGMVNRGRIWHLMAAAEGLCGQDEITQTTEGLPPKGARVCPRCKHVIARLVEAIRIADSHAFANGQEEELPAGPLDGNEIMLRVAEDPRPHSRACGIAFHYHGPQCARDCPTCGGRDRKADELVPTQDVSDGPYGYGDALDNSGVRD